MARTAHAASSPGRLASSHCLRGRHAGLAPAHQTRVASPVSRLDQIVPIYQFSEVHETTIEASPERTYRTICAVTVNEIALLRTLTYIRRFGQPSPDSILNPPGDKPFCEVALSSGFYLLADEPPREIVLGTFVAAPKAARTNPPPQITAATFTAIHSPGFAIAVMNFRLRSIGSTRTRLTTETRVFATDATIRRRFAAYWRVIYPGSSIIRMMWLRAIKRSAEVARGLQLADRVRLSRQELGESRLSRGCRWSFTPTVSSGFHLGVGG